MGNRSWATGWYGCKRLVWLASAEHKIIYLKNTGFQTALDLYLFFNIRHFSKYLLLYYTDERKVKFFFERLFGWTIPLRSRKSSTIAVIEPKVFNCKIPPRYPKVRSDPPTPAGNVDSSGGDLGHFAGLHGEAEVWRQGPGARGSASSDLNKGNGGQCWSTLPRRRKHALAAERNTILDFHKATARTGVHGAKTLKQTSSFSSLHCQYSYCSPLTLTGLNKYLR